MMFVADVFCDVDKSNLTNHAVFVPQRNSQYYEKVSDPLDLSTIEKQILTGHYKTVEAFDTDMLKVFRNAEVGRLYLNQMLLLMILCCLSVNCRDRSFVSLLFLSCSFNINKQMSIFANLTLSITDQSVHLWFRQD